MTEHTSPGSLPSGIFGHLQTNSAIIGAWVWRADSSRCEDVSCTLTDCWITALRESTASVLSPSCKRPQAGLFRESSARNSQYGSGQVYVPDCEQRRSTSVTKLVKPSLLILLHRAFISLRLSGFGCLTFFLSLVTPAYLRSSSRDFADLSKTLSMAMKTSLVCSRNTTQKPRRAYVQLIMETQSKKHTSSQSYLDHLMQ